MDRVHVAGIATREVRKFLQEPIRQVAFDLVSRALDDAGIPKDEVEGFFVTPPSMVGPSTFMFACQMGEYLQLATKSLALVECGGMTSTAALRYAMDEIGTGRIHCALVLAIDSRYDRPTDDLKIMLKEAISTQVCLYGPHDGLYGIGAPIPYYAMSTQRYMYEYGVTEEDLAWIPVRLRENAARNPNAEYRTPITTEEVMASPYLSPPIKLLDSSPFSSSGAACVLVSGEYAKNLKRDTVKIGGFGEYHHPSHFVPLREKISSFVAIGKAAAEAFTTTRVGPSDIDVAEIYGVFSATEAIVCEDIGFFKRGQAWQAFKEGEAGRDGRIPIDMSGGRLSLGHPAAATPMIEFVEIVRQLRGEAGEMQVRDPALGLIHAEHGMVNGSIVMILER